MDVESQRAEALKTVVGAEDFIVVGLVDDKARLVVSVASGDPALMSCSLMLTAFLKALETGDCVDAWRRIHRIAADVLRDNDNPDASRTVQ
ncbi:MAG TPA: hypothetical protein ENI87_05410 [bacterium]|nr:hypothetical protein [bacterium]